MKRLIFLLLFITINSLAHSQVSSLDNYKPYFSAIIVKNIAASSPWYQSVFGLKIKNRIDDSAGAFKIVILESSQYLVELIENGNSLTTADILAHKKEGTAIQGFFKMGFRVSNMDTCIKQMSALKIDVGHVWVDKDSKKRNFLIRDPDGNLIQFFD
jgi:hypothetical protein